MYFQSPMYESEVSQRLVQPGVAVGLAWTPNGGEILFVEASSMPGDGSLTLTGSKLLPVNCLNFWTPKICCNYL